MEVIYEAAPYKISVSKIAGPGIIELLKSTLWGTNTPLYQHKRTEENVFRVPNPLFFSIEKQGKTIGTCCFSKRSISVKGKMYDAWYSRYFAIERQSQGKIFGHLMLKHIKAYFERQIVEPTVFYAYVDQANVRSAKLLQYIGLKSVRNFETLVFSRVFPSQDKRVSRISEGDKAAMLNLLKEQYQEHVMVNFDRFFIEDDYFVLKVQGEILAGLQVKMAEWIICHLPGISGKLIMHLVPHLPLIARLFNPGDFRFAAFEGVYYRKGYEKELFVLMESVCSLLSLNSGMLWLDPESDFYIRLKKTGKWGLLNKFKEDVPGHVVAGFKNIPEKEQEIFYSHPVDIAAFDLI